MPQRRTLGALLGSNTARIEAVLDSLQALSEPVGEQALGPLERQLQVQPGAVRLFESSGQSLQLDASASASVRIHAAGQTARAFEDGDGFAAPPGRSFAELKLRGRFGVAGQGSTAARGSLSLSLGVKAGAEVEYRHLLPVPRDRPRLEALKKVVGGSVLPQLADLRKLEPGEVHELAALFHVDLGVKVAAGGDAGFVGDLFRELRSGISVHVAYVAEASLGLSVYERMKITAGRARLLDPGWVRLRVERERRRRLTLGARFALEVQYDLTAGLQSLLEEALDLLPLRRALDTFRKVRDAADEVAGADWNQIKERLGNEAADEVTELLGGTGWREWITGSDEVRRFLALSQHIVAAYDELDERLQSLWDRLLGRSDLGPGSKARRLLERLAALDPQRPEQLVGDSHRDLIEAVEILSGQSLEEILLASGASNALQEARGLARQALDFLATAPQEFFATFDSFARRTGIRRVVDFLRDSATSPEQLAGSAEAQVRKAVQQLTGKALDRISESDVQRLQAWARRISGVLAKPGEIEATLRKRIERLRGQAGFSVSVEIDRLSRTAAVLDLEIDPRNQEVREAVARIRDSELGSVLRKLPAGQEEPGEAETFPYRIRECVFTTQRVRTSAINLFFSFMGWNRSSRRQVEESTVRITQQGSTFTRDAVHGAAAVLTGMGNDGTAASSAVWVISRGRGSGLDLNAAYDTVEHGLRLTFSREDAGTTGQELDALGLLLGELGFDATPPDHPRNHILGAGGGEAATTRFALDLRLPGSAARSFWRGLGDDAEEEPWSLDVLNALYRWFEERLVPDEFQIEGKMQPTWRVLSQAVRHPEVRAAWVKGRPELDRLALTKTVPIELESGREESVQLARKAANGDAIWGTLVALPISRSHFAISRRPMEDTAEKLARAGQSRRPDDLAALSRSAGKALLAIQPSPGFWANPMLGVWLVIARLSRRDPETLRRAQGLATLRWKDAAGAWSPNNLRTWKLAAGLTVHDRTNGRGLFPIVR